MDRKHLLVLALVMVVMLGMARPGPPAPAEMSATGAPSPFGLNAWVANRFYTDAERERAVQMLAQAGATWLREEFCWSCMERSPQASAHVYRWQFDDWFDYDSMSRLTAAYGLNVLGLLDYGPAADVRDGRVYRRQSCPSDPNAAPIDAWLPAWRAYVGAVVSRYRERIHYWEIQNEPTSLCFWRKVDLPAQRPSAADYVKVLHAAAEVIRQTDPHARVVLGGLSPEIDTSGVDYFQFLSEVQAAGGWPDFDIVALHPYRTPDAPDQVLPRSRFDVEHLRMGERGQPYDLQAELEAFQRLMARWGAKPIWLTEIGWDSASLEARARQRGTTPQVVQADYLIRSAVQALAAGAQTVMWYDFRDDAVPSPAESSFGLISRDFSPKPAYDAFSTLAHVLAGAEFHAQVSHPGDVYEYRFARGRQTIAVLWRSAGGDVPQTVSVDNVGAATVRLIGPIIGPYSAEAGRTVPTTNGSLTVALTERPLFVLFEPAAAAPAVGQPDAACGWVARLLGIMLSATRQC